MEIVSPFKEGIDIIKEGGGETSKFCYQCGLCNAVCPWNTVRNFNVRGIIRQAHLGLTELESEDLWLCTSCRNCVQRCPRGVDIIATMVSARKIVSGWGSPPRSLHPVTASLGAEGNPWGEERGKRLDWAKDLSIKTFTEGTEILYFPCCTAIYDPRVQRVARATAKILKSAEVDFGLLGPQENCCGESIRRAGEEELFQRLAKDNIKSFIENGVKRILVSSPHCYHTFKNEYPELKANFEVVHISQYLAELIDAGRLKLSKEYKKKVIYQDPCYLGRHNDVYDVPREVLKRVPGLELAEFAESRENSVCCGGGGARIWMDTPKDERFSDIRLDEAIQAGSAVLAASCPYCILNFEASRLALEDSEVIEIKDITEIIEEVIDGSE